MLEKYLKAFWAEMLLNGKMLTGLIILQFSSYPGIVAAAQALIANPTKDNALFLVGQILLVVGGLFRAGKIFAGIKGRLGI